VNLEPVLARGVGIVAEIHHSHGIKAALAVRHLHDRFPHWREAFWQGALTQARWFDEPVVDRPVATSGKSIPPARARVLMARSVVPLAYTAIRSWAAERGADDIVRCYVDQAAADPGYLGHRLSILLALGEAWPIYKDSAHHDLYLDRLTEFILACRFGAAQDGGPPSSTASWNEACTAALHHPGFFGHNLICLAWIGRNRESLSEGQLRSSLGWVVGAAGTTYPDAEDNVTIAAEPGEDLTESSLEAGLQALLLRGVKNIHLLTLADAVCWLWDALGHEARPYLLGIAKRHVKL
jgi:hypothetical protein